MQLCVFLLLFSTNTAIRQTRPFTHPCPLPTCIGTCYSINTGTLYTVQKMRTAVHSTRLKITVQKNKTKTPVATARTKMTM